MEYTYRFNLEYKPYRKHESGQPVDDVCNRLADIVFNQRNVSFLYIAQEIADLRGISVQEVKEITTQNAKRIFNF